MTNNNEKNVARGQTTGVQWSSRTASQNPVLSNAYFMSIVPGSERYYCRVDFCGAWTWENVPYGFCQPHLLAHLDGEVLPVKLGFPPVNWKPHADPL